jgi:anti-sigma regulatory factor (Ser/Thr protein kinase)
LSHSPGGSLPTLPRVARLSTQPANAFHAELASTRNWPLRSYLELGALSTAVPCARLHAKNILYEWGMGSLADTVELLVSEIATNAVRASAGPPSQVWSRHEGLPVIRLWITSDRDRILIQVWDSDHHKPIPANAGPDAESGRGLLLVETLSTTWGYYAPGGQGGKIVWALCSRDNSRPT